MDLSKLTIKEARELINKKEITPKELFDLYKSNIEKNKNLNAYINIFDYKEPKVEGGELHGITGAIKDNIMVDGYPATAGSRILENYIATYDATVVERLYEAGAIISGKANMDEFAMGSTGEYSAFGPTLNPLDETRVSGGSSSGPVASVAGSMSLFGLGSETGGSIRVPASWCGVVGLKPTYGRVSRYGLMAMASSLDQIAPVTKNVDDMAMLMNVIAGHDRYDATSSELEVPDYTSDINKGVKGLKIAVPKEFFSGGGLDPKVEKIIRNTISKLEAQGAIVEEVSLPLTDYALATYYVIVPSEVSSNLSRYDGIRYGYSIENKKNLDSLEEVYSKSRAVGFGPEPRRRIMIGTYALSAGYYDAYYLKAAKVRTLIKKDFDKIFEKYDVIVGPTSPTFAPKLGEFDNPLAFYLADVYAVQVNLAGVPAVTVPCGYEEIGGVKLPTGLQIIGKHFDESMILRVGKAVEEISK